MNPLVSVIIPIYNAEKWLRACLDSALGQTYGNTEIILVDDGSADKSGAICDEYAQKDKRVRVIHKENGGASSARNAGLDIMTGEYVYFLDSDDKTVPELLEKLVESAVQNASELVFFDAYAVDEDTGRVSESNYSHREKYEPATGVELMRRMVGNGDFRIAVYLMLLSSDLIRRGGLRFTEGIMYEDFIFTCQAFCLAESVSYVPEYLYYRLYHANSVMTAKKTVFNFRSALTAYRGVRDFSEANGNIVPEKYVARGAHNVFSCYEALTRQEKKTYWNDFEGFKKDIAAHNGYGDASLMARRFGKGAWAARKAVSRIIG